MNKPADDNAADNNSAEAAAPPYQPQLISGKWVILVIAAISIAGSAFGWLWTYDAQRRPRDFWGIQTWKLIGESQAIRAERLVPEPPSTDGSRKPAAYDGLVVVHYDPAEAGRYVVENSKRVENEPGLSYANNSSSLREALANHRSYDWDSKAATLQRPSWRYSLAFAEKTEAKLAEEAEKFQGLPVPNPTATLLFDADCRFVRLPSVDKPVVLQKSVAEQFKKFFEVQVGDAAAAKPQATGTRPPQASASAGTH